MPGSVRPGGAPRLHGRPVASASWTRGNPLVTPRAKRQAGPVTNDVVQIEQVDVHDEAGVGAHHEVLSAAYHAESPDHPLPTVPEVLALVRSEREAVRTELWLMRVDGRPVGTYRLDLPQLDNTDLVEVELGIHPQHQHRGHGRRLCEHVTQRSRELHRHQIVAEVYEPADGSQNRAMRFAEATGARRSLGEMRRVLDLAVVDRARLAALRAEAESRSQAYQLVAWTGPCPDDLVDGYAALIGRMSTDAPMGDLHIEPEHWDAARVRERDTVMAAQGRLCMATAARLGPDGPLVAYTDIVTTRHDPPNAFQWDTIVLREHRGHRLGALVKVANLERLLVEAPDARRVHTWNADENTYMVAINAAMGFAPAQRESAWRLDLPRVD